MPYSQSAPLDPAIVLAAPLPTITLLSVLPVPLIAPEPVRASLSMLEPSVKLTLVYTQSVPALLASVVVSEMLST